ncbi:hypothetical protein GOODEAATRI_030700 [Goodea atripinnis]|uniref:Uncharacterized protein n=1 Tax=Goodea atripinnis TaxID=208336 RepID=A0ABV0P946_9TELE
MEHFTVNFEPQRQALAVVDFIKPAVCTCSSQSAAPTGTSLSHAPSQTVRDPLAIITAIHSGPAPSTSPHCQLHPGLKILRTSEEP